MPLGPSSTVIALREALNTPWNPWNAAPSSPFQGPPSPRSPRPGPPGPEARSQRGSGERSWSARRRSPCWDISRQLNSLTTEQRQHVQGLLGAHLKTLSDFIDGGRYDKATGLRLHTLAASLAQTVAWHRFDHGHQTAAGKLWIAGLHSAHVTGDPDLDAAMLGDLAYQAADHLQLKEPERAAHAAKEALTLSRRIGAPRCERLVQDLVPDFQPYRAADGVPAFLALAAA
ncbi:hypothetical protein AB0953_34720 [Streptomyces sp. NPDC046866]|uniref:hypothetical protein n=1 Tax=Streptomyces sp. NPDC046866 TaxID=3154921 RepID=UPI0034514339